MVFDRFLEDGALDPFNWQIRETAQLRTGAHPCTAAGKVVTCEMAAGILNLGPDIVNYSPPPFDVRSRHDLPAAGFINFPLVVLP